MSLVSLTEGCINSRLAIYDLEKAEDCRKEPLSVNEGETVAILSSLVRAIAAAKMVLNMLFMNAVE